MMIKRIAFRLLQQTSITEQCRQMAHGCLATQLDNYSGASNWTFSSCWVEHQTKGFRVVKKRMEKKMETTILCRV